MTVQATLYSDPNMIKSTTQPLLINLQSIYQALTTLFNTRKAERLFRPEYGFDIDDILFMLIDETTSIYIKQRVIEAINTWEPRVTLDYNNTLITPYPDDNKYDIVLAFNVKGFEEQLFEFEGKITI
jgi:phage baseplate assembly protein W